MKSLLDLALLIIESPEPMPDGVAAPKFKARTFVLPDEVTVILGGVVFVSAGGF